MAHTSDGRPGHRSPAGFYGWRMVALASIVGMLPAPDSPSACRCSASTCSADLRKRPKTVSALRFWLITGSRRFALFRDVSRPARGLRKSGRVTPVTICVAAYSKITPPATGSKPSD